MLKKILAVLLGMILFAMMAVAIMMYLPGTDQVDPLTYFNEFKEGQKNIVYEDTRVDLEDPIIEENGIIYVSQEFAKLYIDKTIFYDANEGIMTITTPQEVMRLYRNGTTIKINGQTSEIQHPILEKNGKGYLPETFLTERYDFNVERGVDERLFLASHTGTPKQVALVKKNKSELRTHPDRKSLIIEKVKKNNEVTVYSIEDGFARVRSENGIIGFIPESHIKIVGDTEVTTRYERPELEPVAKPLEGKVKLVWDQMTVQTTGEWNSNKYNRIQGANVISPTWFEFGDSEGNLIDRGSKTYVDSAHSRGLQVWALMSHNFVETQLTREILISTNKRQHVINQLITAANRYGFDGINIDIENIQEDFAQEWIQFMRELAPQMKQEGITVSVDVYMPSAWSGHYQREELAEIVDYFIVMAYDQHWSGSEIAGPVSGLDWVEQGLLLNLEEVPNHKLVLGIPFFTRIWETTSEGVTSKAYGMDGSLATVRQWGVPIVYDEESGLNYAEVVKGDKTYSVWLEDEQSIQKRLDIIKQHDLAGYGGWKLGLENDQAWNLLKEVE